MHFKSGQKYSTYGNWSYLPRYSTSKVKRAFSKKLLFLVSTSGLTVQRTVCVIHHQEQEMFPRLPLWPVDERRDVQQKWNIRAALMWFTTRACSRSAPDLVFKVSQEITTAFLWMFCVKVWFGRLRACQVSRALRTHSCFSAFPFPTHFSCSTAHNRGWQQRYWANRITYSMVFESERNWQPTLAWTSVI